MFTVYYSSTSRPGIRRNHTHNFIHQSFLVSWIGGGQYKWRGSTLTGEGCISFWRGQVHFKNWKGYTIRIELVVGSFEVHGSKVWENAHISYMDMYFMYFHVTYWNCLPNCLFVFFIRLTCNYSYRQRRQTSTVAWKWPKCVFWTLTCMYSKHVLILSCHERMGFTHTPEGN